MPKYPYNLVLFPGVGVVSEGLVRIAAMAMRYELMGFDASMCRAAYTQKRNVWPRQEPSTNVWIYGHIGRLDGKDMTQGTPLVTIPPSYKTH